MISSPRETWADSFVVFAVGLQVLDVFATLSTPALETNPLVLALGFQTWALLKGVLLIGFVGAYLLARGHQLAPYATIPCVGIGLLSMMNLSRLWGGPTGRTILFGIVALVFLSVLVRFKREIKDLEQRDLRRLSAVFLTLILVISGVPLGPVPPAIEPTSASDPAEGTWDPISDMPTERWMHPTVESGGAIYAIGGANTGSLSDVDRYYPSNDTWEQVASLPTARREHAAAVDSNGNIYAMGGYDTLSTVEKYDPDSDSWSTVASLPQGKDNLAAASLDGKIYAIGGKSGSNAYSSTVHKYYPSNDTWVQVASLNTGRQMLSAVALDGHIYAMGGFDGSNTLSTVEKYYPSNDSWVTVSSMPVSREHFAAASTNGNVYAIAGNDGSSTLSQVDKYYPSNDSWVTVNSTGTSREDHGAAAADGHIYATGGGGGSRTVDAEKYNAKGTSGPTGQTINGTVINQNGQPVGNATIVAYGTQFANLSIDKNREKVESLADPTPQSWKDLASNPDLVGDSGLWSPDNVDSYVSTHTKEALPSTAPWLDNPNLDGTATLSLPANEKIILGVWDADGSGVGQNTCLPGVGSEYNCQMPGTHKKDATIVVERIGPGGDIVSSNTLELTKTSGGGFADPDRFKYATAELPPGYYYIHEEGAPRGVPRKVGKAPEIIDRYQEDLNSSLSTHGQEVKQLITDGDLVRNTTKTAANGSYSLTIPSGVKVVRVQAVSAPGVVGSGYSAENITQETIISEYNQALEVEPGERTEAQRDLVNSSVYFPSITKTVEPPASDVEITVYELRSPPGANVSALQSRLDRLEDLLRNMTFSDLPAALQQRLNETSREDLEEVHAELQGLANENEKLRERLNESVLEADQNEITNETLRNQISRLENEINELESTGAVEEGDVSTDNGTVSLSWGVPDMNLGASNVSVIAHYANGSSRVVPEEYIRVERSAFGSDSVHLEEYPLGETDPSSVQFKLRISSSQEIRRAASTVKNPTFSGDLPRLSSVSLSTTTPGPSENVSISVNPEESGSFKSITNVTVYGPDGSQISTAPIENGKESAFTTAGKGIYHIRLEISTTEGTTAVLPVRIKALGTDMSRPPTISVRDSPIGEYALVGDGLEDAEVTSDGGGQSVDVLAKIGESAETPSRIDLHLEEVATPSSSTTSVTLVRGESLEHVAKHVPIRVHYRGSETPLVWRNGDPIPSGEASRKGVVRDTGSSIVVETYTEGDGTVRLKRVSNPSISQQVSHFVGLQLAKAGIDASDLPLTFGLDPSLVEDLLGVAS